MKKSIFLTTAVVALGATGFATYAQDKTVTYRSWSPVLSTTKKMVTATQAALPGISVDTKIFNYNEYLVDLQTRAASGDMPDIIGLQPGALTQQYREFLMPVQDCAVSLWGDDWQSKFYPIAIDQLRLGNPEGDENFYGLPVLTQVINLWYIKPVLEDLGVEAPTTYAELKALAELANAKGYAPMVIGAGDGWINRDVFAQIINNISPGALEKAQDGEMAFTDGAFEEALQVWKNFFDDGIFQPGALGLSHYPGAVEIAESGRAAILPMGAWWNQQAGGDNPTPLSENLAGYVAFPFVDVSGNGVSENFVGGIDIMIGMTKDVDDADAACQVMGDWISGSGAQQLINTFNDLPAFVGLNPDSFGSESHEAVWNRFVNEWLPKATFTREMKSPAVKQALEEALAAVAAGDMLPSEAAGHLQAAFDNQ